MVSAGIWRHENIHPMHHFLARLEDTDDDDNACMHAMMSLIPVQHPIISIAQGTTKPTNSTPSDDDSYFNGMTFGILHAHLDLQTSLARTVCCRRRGVFCRIAPTPASTGSWSARRRTSGSMR